MPRLVYDWVTLQPHTFGMNDVSMTFYALCLLWIGAMSFGLMVLLRNRWQEAMAEGRPVPATNARKGVEAALMFAGSGGMILGLGLLGLSVLR